MRYRAAMAITVVLALLVTGPYVWGRYADRRSTVAATGVTSSARPATAPTSTEAPPPARVTLTAPLLHSAPVTVATTAFWSWALLDRRTGEISGSANFTVANSTASMIKAWLAADYLRMAAERGVAPGPAVMRQLRVMIRNSDNAAASATWRQIGARASVERLIAICGLTDSRPYLDWAHTMLSARDSARMGGCIGDGRAAGAHWTEWVLNEMRSVSRTGRFGILPALPAAEAARTAVKNGWIARRDGKWHVNCLAVGPDWSLAVMTVYPAAKGMGHGAAICTSVTQQLMAPTG